MSALPAREPTASRAVPGSIAAAQWAQIQAVAPQAAAKAAVLFDHLWRQTPLSQSILIRAANRPDSETTVVSLARLGGAPGSFEVLERGDWTAAFDIGVFGATNRLPKELVIDVANLFRDPQRFNACALG